MRVAILADPIDLQSAGIHVYTKNMVEALVQENSQHEYLLIRPRVEPVVEGARTLVVPIIPGLAAIRWTITIPRLLRRMAVDCVIEPAHFGPVNLPAAVRRITFIHDLTPLKFPEYHPLPSQILQRLFLPHILRKTSCIMTNSEQTTRDVLECFPWAGGKVVTNHLGVSTEFRPTSSIDVLNRYSIRQPYFLYTGTIEPRKNLEVLLDAFALLKQRTDIPVQLVIAGRKGWKTTSFFERYKNHRYRSDILLTGYVPKEDLPVLYTMARAFVFPSHYEGFGLPVLEAMRCGTPCILSNVSSLPEIGGKAALYFQTYSADGLCEQMIASHEDEKLRGTMKQAGMKQAEQFTWKKHAEVIRSVL